MKRLLLTAALALVLSCEKAAAPSVAATPPASAAEAPNANAGRYGPHGVTQVPAAAPPEAPQGAPGLPQGAPAAPPLDAAHEDMAGHPCQCGGSCHCGHCSGLIAGCHCKPKRADGK